MFVTLPFADLAMIFKDLMPIFGDLLMILSDLMMILKDHLHNFIFKNIKLFIFKSV